MAARKKATGNSQATVPLQMNTTQAAAYASAELSLKPCDWVNVYGQPGLQISCSCGSGGAIVDAGGTSYGTGPYQPTLDQNGLTSFTVTAKAPQRLTLELFAVQVYAQDPSDTDNNIAKISTFQGYTDGGNGHILGYNITTGAPNDGKTPCCLYLQVAPNLGNGQQITKVKVTVDGSAQFLGTSLNSMEIPLGGDGNATAAIVDTVAEVVNLRFGLPESPDQDQDNKGPFPVRFVAFPNK